MAGFKAAAAKFQQDATSAMAQTKDQASFAKAYAVVVSNCGAFKHLKDKRRTSPQLLVALPDLDKCTDRVS